MLISNGIDISSHTTLCIKKYYMSVFIYINKSIDKHVCYMIYDTLITGHQIKFNDELFLIRTNSKTTKFQLKIDMSFEYMK